MPTVTAQKIVRLRLVAVLMLCAVTGTTCSQLVKLGQWPYAVTLGAAALLVTTAELASRWR